MGEKKKFRLSVIFGEFGKYTPPVWMKSVGAFFCGKTPKLKKARKISLFSLAGICALIGLTFAGMAIYRFILSKQPVKIELDVSFESPDVESSTLAEMVFEFNGSAAKADEVEKTVNEPIEITPPINGTWKWENESKLVFVPSEDWKISTDYTVKLPKELFPDHVRVLKSKFSFSTVDFTAFIEDEEFYIDPTDENIKRVLFSIRSNFPMDPKSLDGLVHIKPDMINSKNGTLEKKNYSYTASWSSDKYRVDIASEPIGTPSKSISMNIDVDKGLISTLGGEPAASMSSSITIPGATEYASINSVEFSLAENDNQEYEQLLVFETTAKTCAKDLSEKMEVYVLPRDKPEEPGLKQIKYCDWTDIAYDQITDTVLKNSKKLTKLEAQPTELDYESRQSFKFDIAPDSYLYIKIGEGTKFYGGYYLSDPYQAIVRVGSYPTDLGIMSEGTILSLRGSHKIPMYSRGITSARFNIWRMKPSEINHIVALSNGDMKNFNFNNYNFNQYNVSEEYTDSCSFEASDAKRPTYFSYDFSKLLVRDDSKGLRNGLFLFNVSDSYGHSSKRLIIVSDFGLFVKKTPDGSREVFVQSIADGTPVSDALVNVVALNGNVLQSGYTTGDGNVSLPVITNSDSGNRPVAITVQKGEDLCFMPYNASGRTVDYSDYDVGGEYGIADPDKIHAYLFSDRGIYRPGDEARLGLIVKANNWSKNLGNTPLEYVVTDPNGTQIADKEFNLDSSGFDEIKFSTHDYSPTGEYTISVYLLKKYSNGEMERSFLGSEQVKVEEFLPDTLSITTAFNPLPSAGWIKPDKLSGLVTLRNLFGSVAAGNTIKAQIELEPGFPRFTKFRGYSFTDPFVNKKNYIEPLDEMTTDEEGHALYDIDLKKFEKASYLLRFYAEGFEKGSGRNVSSESTVYVSPLDYLIGVKADGDLGYIKKDMKRVLSFIAVGSDLHQVAVNDVTMRITENKYVSVLVKQQNGVYKYQSVKKEYPVLEQKVSIPIEGFDYALPVSSEGEFVLTLENKDGLQFNRTFFSIIGEHNIERSLTRTAELEVKTEKSDYKNGETIQLFVKAPYAGSGLIAVEREKVYTYKWFHSDGASSIQTITVPQGLEGNAYVTIMYSRAYDSQEIYMSPFCYAAVPFSISLDNRINKISLSAPSDAKPGEDYKITYATDKPGKIVIMAIDEGILQVAGYKLPDPLSTFYKKRALEVSTSQLLDLVLPEFKVLQTVSAVGGDADYDETLTRNLNPFKRKRNQPVAYWSGIVDANQTEQTVTYHIPDYFNGRIRVMAVAVSQETVGVTQTATEVKDTFVIAPNVPTFAAPGDEFEVSVTVTNNENKSGAKSPVTLTLKPSKHLTVISDATVKLTIPEGRDATTTFKIRANDVVGGAELLFTASSAKESSHITSTLSVRPAMPYQVWLQSGVVRKDKDTLSVNKKMYDEFATRKVSLAYVPLALTKGLQFYLEKYPYGCSEQVTSAVYPYLFPDLLKDSGKTQADAQDAVANLISILQSRQRRDGSIGYWTYLSDNYPALDAYCAMFLTDAKERGYYVPKTFMNNLLSSLKSYAGAPLGDSYSFYARAFSIYVLTRNEVVTTSYIERLQKDLKNATDQDAFFARLFLAASYKMLKMDKEANEVLAKVKRNVQITSALDYPFEDSLYYASMYLYVVSKYFPERLSDVSIEQLEFIEKQLADQNYNTLSSAVTLLGLESYLEAVPSAETGLYSITEIAGKNETPLTASGSPVFSALFSGAAEKLLIKNSEKTNLFYQLTQAGFVHDVPTKETKDGIEVYREFQDEKGKTITSMNIGDSVIVKVRFRTVDPKRPTISNVAIVDLLPAGLEADADSIRSSTNEYKPDYVDIREDRLVLFGSVINSFQTFTYKARAINKGKFTVPPLFAEAMYDKTVRAIKPQGPITVNGK